MFLSHFVGDVRCMLDSRQMKLVILYLCIGTGESCQWIKLLFLIPNHLFLVVRSFILLIQGVGCEHDLDCNEGLTSMIMISILWLMQSNWTLLWGSAFLFLLFLTQQNTSFFLWELINIYICCFLWFWKVGLMRAELGKTAKIREQLVPTSQIQATVCLYIQMLIFSEKFDLEVTHQRALN